jgi:hypothetical protein
LPVPPTPLVGRVGEVADIVVRLADRRTRLLTLTGPGGVGKTRLAVAAAARAADSFPAGVRFVQLADIGDAALVPSLIARAVGVNPSREPVLDLVTGAVRDSPLLLVLDTVEHVLDAAPHVSALLVGCPRLVPAVADVCARLDGLPLAIELAASRSRHFPPGAVLAQLDRRLPLMAPARQTRLGPTRLQIEALLTAAKHPVKRCDFALATRSGSSACRSSRPPAKTSQQHLGPRRIVRPPGTPGPREGRQWSSSSPYRQPSAAPSSGP